MTLIAEAKGIYVTGHIKLADKILGARYLSSIFFFLLYGLLFFYQKRY
jgi:hypothetical protein